MGATRFRREAELARARDTAADAAGPASSVASVELDAWAVEGNLHGRGEGTVAGITNLHARPERTGWKNIPHVGLRPSLPRD